MDKLCDPALYNGYYILFQMQLKLIHIKKTGPWTLSEHTSQLKLMSLAKYEHIDYYDGSYHRCNSLRNISYVFDNLYF